MNWPCHAAVARYVLAALLLSPIASRAVAQSLPEFDFTQAGTAREWRNPHHGAGSGGTVGRRGGAEILVFVNSSGVGRRLLDEIIDADINDTGVVADHPDREVRLGGGIGDAEGAAEIGGDVLQGWIRAVADHRGFIAVPVAELSLPAGPRTVVEGIRAPRRALVGAGDETNMTFAGAP